MKARAAAAVAVVFALAACSRRPKPDIPIYPDAQGMKAMGMSENETQVLYNSRWATPASVGDVRIFYEGKLLTRPGWEKRADPFGERAVFSDGNMHQGGGQAYGPIDESRPGGYVEIINGGAATIVTIWQYFPKKR